MHSFFSRYPTKYSIQELNDEVFSEVWQLIIRKGAELLQSLEKRIILKIQKNGRETMSSPDDSSLKNLWDEYCVQMQSEKGWSFRLQEEFVEGICLDQLQVLKEKNKLDYDILALYISTSFIDRAIEDEFPIYGDGEISLAICSQINSIASNYTNNRIERYLY